MEKAVELTKKTFSKEFIKLVPKVSEISEMLWFLFKLGGSAQTDIISARFPNFDQDKYNLISSGILETKGDVSTFTEEFEERLLSTDMKQLNVSDISSILIENYHEKLMMNFSFDSLIDPISTIMASVILSSSPEQPALMSRILRTSENLFADSMLALKSPALADHKAVLETFLDKSLRLVESSESCITLSEKAKQIIENNSELSELYNKELGEKAVKGKTRALKKEKSLEDFDVEKFKEEPHETAV